MSFELHCSPLLQRNFGQGRGISSKFLTLQPTLTSKFWPRGVVIPQKSSHCSPTITSFYPPGPNNTLTVTTKWEDFKEDIQSGEPVISWNGSHCCEAWHQVGPKTKMSTPECQCRRSHGLMVGTQCGESSRLNYEPLLTHNRTHVPSVQHAVSVY